MAARHLQANAPPPQSGDRAQWTLPASIAAIAPARRHARTWLTTAGAPAPEQEATVLVVSELVTNAVRASAAPDGTIRLQLARTPAGWKITVADRGEGFTSSRPPHADHGPLTVGGRGLPVVTSVAGAVSVRHHPGGWTVVSAVVPASARAEGAIMPEESGRSGR